MLTECNTPPRPKANTVTPTAAKQVAHFQNGWDERFLRFFRECFGGGAQDDRDTVPVPSHARCTICALTLSHGAKLACGRCAT